MSEENLLTKEIAEQFVEDEDSVDLSEFTTIEDGAAESLSKSGSSLWLNGLTTLSEYAATRRPTSQVDPPSGEAIESGVALSYLWCMRCTALLLFLLVGCKPSAPGERIDDPRAYVLEQLAAVDFNSWVAPYRITDAGFIKATLDQAITREFKEKGLPHDQSKLDRFVKRELMFAYRSAHLRTPESRAIVLANVKAKYAQPAIVTADNDRVALFDFGSVPGEWVKGGRAKTWLLRPSLDKGLLPQADLQRAFKALVGAYPKAQIYDVRYQFTEGLADVRACLVYDRATGVLWKAHGVPRSYATVSINDLLAGSAPFGGLGFTHQARDRANRKNAAFPNYKAPMTLRSR